MRKILSLVLVLAMVLGSFSFAAVDYTTVGNDLKTLGVLKGDAQGNLNENNMLTREESMVVLIRLLGKEAEAMATTTAPSYTDVPAGHWAAPYIAYAELNSLTNGIGDGKFGLGQHATTQTIAMLMLRALGYGDTAWADAIATATTMGLLTDVTAGATDMIIRGDVFVMMNNTLNATPKDGDKALVYVLGLKEMPAPAVLAVESVKALNLKEVEVVFNMEVDKTTAETAANYVFSGGTAATPVASLQADNKTVLIVLTTKATQQDETKVTIKDVKDLAGNKLASVENTITFFDATVPTAMSLALTGPTTLEVTFSEVMDSTVNPTILVNNGIYGATFTSWSGRVATFTLSAALTEADYTVKIAGAKDAAGYLALTKEFTLAYATDKTVPTVSVDKATQLRVTFKFDKKVKNITTANFYHTFSGWTSTAVYEADGTTALLSSVYTDTVVVQFATDATTGHPLVAGNNMVTVLVGGSGSEIQDLWGNKLAADAKFTVEVAADTTAPTITKTETTSEKVVKLTFDEDVLGATTVANYTVYDKDGKEVSTVFVPTYASKVATLTFASNLAAGNYTVKVAGITDASIYANKITTVTLPFTISDKTAATGITAEWVADGSNYIVYVTFSEDMQADSILNKANYRLEGLALATADKIELFGGSKVVKITTATDMSGNDIDVTVKNVVDASGNALDLFTTLTAANVATAAAPTVGAVKTIALNKIEVTMDKHLSAAPAAAFEVNNVAPAAVTYVNNSDGTSTVTMTLQAAGKLTDEGDVTVVIDIVASTVKSFTGKVAATGNALQTGVTDGIAPKLIATTPIKTVDANADGQIDAITVTYTEDLAPGYYTPATFTVAGYTVTSITEAAGVVTINITPKAVNDTDAIPVVTQVQDLYDVALNKLAAADFAATATTDKAAPLLKTVVLANGSGTATDLDVNDTITLTFNEKMTVTGNGTFAMTNGVITLLDTTTLTFGTVGVNAGTGTVAWSADGKVATLTFTAVTDTTTEPSGALTPGAVVIKDAKGNVAATTASTVATGTF